MLELIGVFIVGVVLSGVYFGLLGVSWGWDFGYRAGELAERQKWGM